VTSAFELKTLRAKIGEMALKNAFCSMRLAGGIFGEQLFERFVNIHGLIPTLFHISGDDIALADHRNVRFAAISKWRDLTQFYSA